MDVYSSGDEVELFLNGKSLGKKAAGKKNHFTAEYEVPYKPGVLQAVAYRCGEVIGEYQIATAGEVKRLGAEQVTENEQSLAYVKVCLVDENGQLNMQEVKKIYVQIEGNGELEGFGTAEPAGEENYFSDCVTTYDGYAMLAVRKKDPKKEEEVYIHFYAEGCEEMELQIRGGGKSEKR